ncbi:NUDIX hydrolase [Halovulum sp. GXIMD14793]
MRLASGLFITATMGSTTTILIAAAALCRSDGMTLLVRKRGTIAFMQPGGKIDPGETPVDALCRELDEELGLSVQAAETHPLGQFSAPAANEAGHIVLAYVFLIETDAAPHPAAEIEEVRWIDPTNPGHVPLAPLTRDHILPLVAKALGLRT